MLFSVSKGFAALVLGRALIGLGVAAAFTGGLKAIVLWFPKDRVAAMNGWMVMLGALGALSATSPAEVLLDWSGGWRGLFAILAAATVASALAIWVIVPEATSAKPSSHEHAPISPKIIYNDPRFWGLAPLSATCAGTAWALQGLWAAPWLTDVDGLPQAIVTRHLFIIAIVQGIAALLLGSAADRLRRRGIGPQVLLGFVATTFIAAQLALTLQFPVSSYLPWSIVAAAGSVTILSYAILAEYFPKEVTGRANGALNLFHFGAATIPQSHIRSHWASIWLCKPQHWSGLRSPGRRDARGCRLRRFVAVHFGVPGLRLASPRLAAIQRRDGIGSTPLSGKPSVGGSRAWDRPASPRCLA
jgi:MFS family permease